MPALGGQRLPGTSSPARSPGAAPTEQSPTEASSPDSPLAEIELHIVYRSSMMKWWTLVLLLFSMISSITKSYILRVSQPIFQKSRLSPLFGFSLLRKIAKTTLLSTDEDSAPYTMMNAALDEGSTITDEEPYEIGVQRSLSKPQTLVTEASKLANSGKKARAEDTYSLLVGNKTF